MERPVFDLLRDLIFNYDETMRGLKDGYEPRDEPSKTLCRVTYGEHDDEFEIFRTRTDGTETRFRVKHQTNLRRVRAIDTLGLWALQWIPSIDAQVLFGQENAIRGDDEARTDFRDRLFAHNELDLHHSTLYHVTHRGRTADLEVYSLNGDRTFRMIGEPGTENVDFFETLERFMTHELGHLSVDRILNEQPLFDDLISRGRLEAGPLTPIDHDGRRGVLKTVFENNEVYFGVDDSYLSRTLEGTLQLFKLYPCFSTRMNDDAITAIAPTYEKRETLYQSPFFFKGILYQVRKENGVYQVRHRCTGFHDFDCVDRLLQLEVMDRCAIAAGQYIAPLQVTPPGIPRYWLDAHHFELDGKTEITVEPPGGFAFTFVEMEVIRNHLYIGHGDRKAGHKGTGNCNVCCLYWQDGFTLILIEFDGGYVTPDETFDGRRFTRRVNVRDYDCHGELKCIELLVKAEYTYFEDAYESFAQFPRSRSLDYLDLLLNME